MNRATLYLLGVVLGLGAIDRISKSIALLSVHGGVLLYPGLASLSIWIVAPIYVGIVLAGAWYGRKTHSIPFIAGWALVACGGASNIYDRIVYGHVIDWIVVGPFFVCNIADVLIGVGIAVCIYSLFVPRKPQAR